MLSEVCCLLASTALTPAPLKAGLNKASNFLILFLTEGISNPAGPPAISAPVVADVTASKI